MSNFSQWLWLLIWWFLFVVYLMILFQIIGDLFRDRELSGWWKALWIIGLIFIPFLSALIYLIARGRSMTERQISKASELEAAQADYIKQVAGAPTSPADQISSAKALLDSGAIDQDEFAILKAKALA